MATIEKNDNVTGLNNATDRAGAEYDLVKALFEAAAYKTAEDNIVPIDITRNGKFLFTLHIHPISDEDVAFANKQAAKMGKNPNGKHLPKIQVDFDKAAYKSWLIYLATTKEDQEKIWGNPELKARLGIYQNWETIDKLLTMGDKNKLLEKITDISGLNDDDDDEEMDDVTFQS